MPPRLSMAEKRARNRSVTSLLWTPPAYPGYSSCLGSLTRVEPSGLITFVPYGGEDEYRPPYEPEYIGPSSLHISKDSSCKTPPLCSPEDDSEFQDNRDPSRKTSPSSGYGSGESDQEIQMIQSYYVGTSHRSSRQYSRKEREVEKWRRRSVPAVPRMTLPSDVTKIMIEDGHFRWETNVDTGEQIPMEIRGIRRPESVMQLARKFGEIGAAQEKDLRRSRTSLDDRESGYMAGRPNIFKQMEKVGPATVGPPKPMNPNSIKDALLRWVQNKVQGYPHVSVTNFSSSWADGMAFCALIHHFMPHAFDFNQLKPEERKKNLELAFKVSEDAGICPLLEVDDMIMMGDRPDYKCIFTYVQCFYKHFRNTN